MLENLTLLIPAKKEKESLIIFLNELKNYKCKKLIVLAEDDIETLNSIKEFIENPLSDTEIFFQKQKGYGAALVEGSYQIRTKYLCIINADGSMNPKYLKIMLDEIQRENLDFVFCSRYEKDGGSEDDDIITLIGNKIFTFMGNFMFSLNISDILYTYILGKTDSFINLNLKSNDFRYCIEMPVKAKFFKKKYSVVGSYERKRIGGKKKVNALIDGSIILYQLIKMFIIRK